ncbi:MAG: hypothetical protein GOP50_10855 [Candidatus Heimdallarchaeota archaeon]|nr:hypothetical protein [Candidatus Heimdallarchaeota archaeon]
MVVFEVNEVTLYKMGIGWLSSQASFKDKEVSFPVLVKNQDDFLKTFHVDVTGDIMLSSIAFDTEESKDLEIDHDRDALTSIINILSGSRVTVDTKDEKNIEGKLIGYQIMDACEEASRLEIILMTDDYKIHHISSNDLQNILPQEEFFKKTILEQIDLLSKSKKENVKNIKINFTDEGEKDVTISYLSELPAWLSSYRIYNIDDKNAVFELWSLVTNNSQQDWIDAKIHLITGLPLSFRYDISSPWIIDRPFVQRPKQMGINVMTPEADYDMKPKVMPSTAPGRGAARMKSAKKMDRLVGLAEEPVAELYDYAAVSEDSAEVITTTESIAFSLKQLVTIKKGESALLLLHSAKIPKETINIYNQHQHATHPFKAIEVENTVGYGWEAGPVTLYEKGIYAGESMLPRVTKGDKQILPYLVEQDIMIKQEEFTTTKKIGISLSNQYYVETYLNTKTFKLELDNKSDEEKVVIAEVPKQYGYKINKKKMKLDSTETANFFRTKITLEPKTTIKVEVPTERKTSESVSIASISDEYLDELLKLETLKANQISILKKIKQLRKEKYKINEQVDSEQSNLNRIDNEYQRITESIKVLTSEGDEAKTRSKYVERMNNLFETMEEKRKLLEKQQTRLDEIDEEIYKILDDL